jgi:TRAP-type C4-dicarboxylate transport system permease small subunit
MASKSFAAIVTKIGGLMIMIASGALVVMLTITLADIILRMFGRPIVGVFELVSFLGAVVVGFSMSSTSLNKGHVYVDFLIDRFPKDRQNVMNITTRILAVLLFAIMSWYFFQMGMGLYVTGTVSGGLKMPFYPVIFGLAVSCLAECLALVLDIVNIWRQP